MRVFVLGKPREVTHWTEDCVAGLQAAGHTVALGVTRDARLHPGLERLLMASWTGAWPLRRLQRAIRDFRPDLILAVRAFATPAPMLDAVAAMAGRPPLVGWVGDSFSPAIRPIADCFDLLAYTDTAMLALHQASGFRAGGLYLPHAANTRLLGTPATAAPPTTAQRDLGLVFVANPTPRRRMVIGAMTQPVALFGPGWTPIPDSPHLVAARGVGVGELGELYARAAGVLNISHEANVTHGLNQRHFDPGLLVTPVLADAQLDLPRCFEPGREMLVWANSDELNALHAQLLRDPAWARQVGTMAHRRVTAEHLYGHRLETIAREL